MRPKLSSGCWRWLKVTVHVSFRHESSTRRLTSFRTSLAPLRHAQETIVVQRNSEVNRRHVVVLVQVVDTRLEHARKHRKVEEYSMLASRILGILEVTLSNLLDAGADLLKTKHLACILLGTVAFSGKVEL